MGVAYHLSRRVGVQAADTVAVFGLGPIGLGVVAMWSFLGARVIGVDMSLYRRELAEKLGAWKTVEAGKKNTIDRLRKLTGGAGPDTCLECTGKPDPVTNAFEAVRQGGKIGLVGEQGLASFNPSRDLIHKEVNVYGAWYFPPARVPRHGGVVQSRAEAQAGRYPPLPACGRPEGLRPDGEAGLREGPVRSVLDETGGVS